MSKESEEKAAAEVLRVKTVMRSKAAEQQSNVDIAADNLADRQTFYGLENARRKVKRESGNISRQNAGIF